MRSELHALTREVTKIPYISLYFLFIFCPFIWIWFCCDVALVLVPYPEVSPLCHQYCRKQLMRHLLSLMSSQTLIDGLITSSSVSLCLERQLIETKIYFPVFLESGRCDCVSDITGQRKWQCVCAHVWYFHHAVWSCWKLASSQSPAVAPPPLSLPICVFSLSALLFCISLCLS